MISAVAERPPDVDQDTITPDTPSPPETAPEVQVTTTKPEGVTAKTWNALSKQGMIFFNARCAGADALTAYDTAGYDPDGTNTTHRRRNARNIERAKRMVKVKLEYEQHREECDAFDKRCDLDWIVANHKRIMAAAHKKGDLAVETRNLELIGRTRGVYADTVQVDVAARREYSEAEKIEGRRLARLMLEDMQAEDVEGGKGDHRGASVSDSAQDPAASQGGEILPADTAPKAAPGKVDTRADRTGESEGTPLTPAAAVGYSGPDTITKPEPEVEPEGDEEPAVVDAVV